MRDGLLVKNFTDVTLDLSETATADEEYVMTAYIMPMTIVMVSEIMLFS